MNSTLNWLRRALYLGMAFGLFLDSRGANAQGPVTVSFSLQQTDMTLHEPVFLNFSVRSNVGESIKFDLGFDAKEGFRFSVRQPEGSTVKLPSYSRGGLGVGGKRILGPGKAYHQTIIFNELYAPNRPGDYAITAELVAPIQTESGQYLKPHRAVTLSLRVGDHDPEHLAAVCERLAKASTESESYEVAREAAFALSYVPDEVAVPFLSRVLRNGDAGVKPLVIEGLARIGSPEAADALKSSLETIEPYLRSTVDGALWEIKTGKKLDVLD